MRPPSPSPNPQPCPLPLQALRDSLGAWLLRLVWAVFFGMLCELASLLGYRVYAPYTTLPLQAAWFAAWRRSSCWPPTS